MTEQNLRNAFTAESCAHMRYLIFAQKAEDENKPNIARLFKAIAYAEQVHARNHLMALGDVKKTEENLQSAVDSENYEIEEMYPAYDSVAKLQSEMDSIQSIHYAIEAEKPHSTMFADAKKAVQNNEDIKIDIVYICPNCGYTQTGDVESQCPICGNLKENFKTF